MDLAHLLRSFDLAVQYFTLTLGTNPGFVEEAFYGHMQEDESRVAALFKASAWLHILISCNVMYLLTACAPNHFTRACCLSDVCIWVQKATEVGIDMQQRSVPDRELQACLAGGQHLAVVLVDKHILELGLPLWSESQPPLQGYTGELHLLRYQSCT